MAFYNNEQQRATITKAMILEKPLPEHIAIIMDGNGRWAMKQGLPRVAGHRVGVESLKKVVRCFDELNIKYLTVYAFSTENWKRPADEVDALMELLVEFIDKELDYLDSKGVKINPIGYIDQLTGITYEKIRFAQDKTKNNTKLVLNIAFNYGGRAELVEGIKQICRDVQSGQLDIDAITEEVVPNYLYTKGIPDPDLLIRASGEMRISNFLLWQIAYTEFWTADVLWPDFKKEDLWQAIYDFQNRQRRYGGI